MQLMSTSALTLAVTAFASAPALAENTTGTDQARAAGGGSKQDQSAKAAVVGEVVDTREVTISGTAGNQHKLYKLRTAEGKTVIMDVGQVSDSSQTPQLQQGDRIMAIGSKARINGQPVLFARYYGESHAAGRNAREQDQR